MDATGLRTHQISFVIGREHRTAVAEWLTETRAFFSSAAATSRKLQSSPVGGLVGSRPTTTTTVAGMLTIPGVGSALNSGGGGPNVYDVGQSKGGVGMQVEDILEGITVQCTVQLIANLNHQAENIRVQAAYLICGLARIFDRGIVEGGKKKIERLFHALQTDEKGYHSTVHELFHIIGPALSTIVVAVVAGLECFYTCPNPITRGICVTALTRLIFENEKIFMGEDHLAAIWNLFFSLSSLPLISKFFADRIVIIKGLGLLAPLYAASDAQLTLRIVESLLRLPNKTASELETIKLTLKKIFERLIESTSMKKESSARLMYELFMELLNPTDEYAYDLLPWALETYTTSLYNPNPQERKQTPPKEYPLLIDFVKSLSNHYRATPSLVRYGACICLYTAQNLCPTLLSDNKQLISFTINGCLDADYLSAFLYLARIESIKPTTANANLKKMIADYRHHDYQDQHYDIKFSSVPNPKTEEITLISILDVAVTASPPLPSKTFQRLANSLEYVSKGQKLKLLNQIKLWSTRTEQFDTFLMQSLVPLLMDPEGEVQLATVSVFQRLGPSFETATAAEFAFFWSHLRTLMLNSTTRPDLLEAILAAVTKLPLQILNANSRSELISTLFKLIFNPVHSLRSQVYKLIGMIPEIWKGDTTLMHLSFSLLLLAVGEQNLQALSVVVSYLSKLEKTNFKALVPYINAIHEAFESSNYRAVLKAYDELANTLQANPSEFNPLTDIVSAYAYTDEWWNFFLAEVPESQLVNTDEYSFTRNFVHSPFWIGIFFTKLGVPPPPGSGQDVEKRTMVPATPAGRRRFVCGFLLTIFPTSGIPDPSLRKAAVIACVRCCFRQNVVIVPIMRGLLEYVSQQMLTHRHWAYKLSGIEILACLTRMKLPGLSQSIFMQHSQAAIDFGHNTPTSMMKLGALEFIETLLLVFPNGISSKLQEIRDTVRLLITDKDPDVAEHACQIYPLVFYTVSGGNSEIYYQYLKSEINTIEKGGLEVAGDPLVSKLSENELARVMKMSMLCMGALKSKEIAFEVVQELLPYLKSSNRSIRHAALSTILETVPLLDSVQRSMALWITLPLSADPCSSIRHVWNRFLKKAPSTWELTRKLLPPHPDDSHLINIPPLEEILTDTANITANSKNFVEALMDTMSIVSVEPLTKQLPEEENMHLPTVSPRLMANIKSLVSIAECGVVPGQNVPEIVYFIQNLQKNVHMESTSILVLSEFCNFHEGAVNDAIDIFTSQLSVEQVTSDCERRMEACMLALRNISANSPAIFKVILNKMSAPAIPTEGDLIGLFYLSDCIKEVCPSRAPELLRKYLPVVTSQRHPMTKRLWAIYFSVEISLIAGHDEMARVLDAVQAFVESCDDEEVKAKVYAPLGKILGQLGPKHALFRTMLTNAKKQVYSKDVKMRKKSLSVFRVFARYLSAEEAMWFCSLYLADPKKEIRHKGREIMVYENLLEFIGNAVKNGAVKAKKKDSPEKETVHDPNTQGDEPVLIIPLPVNQDKFNIKYYNGTKRRKFTSRYGLNEALFAKHKQPLTLGLLDLLNEKVDFEKVATEAKAEELMNINIRVILHECMKKFQTPAVELIETVLTNVEKLHEKLDEKEYDESKEDDALPDVQSELHALEVLSRLLRAYDGVGDQITPWMQRLQKFIEECCVSSSVLREGLYADLENSFFFYNEFVDIPIVSDEQYEALKNLKAQSQEAVADVVRASSLEKLSRFDSKRAEMNDTVDNKSEHLRRFSIMVVQATLGFGRFYTGSSHCSEAHLIQSFKFLASLLENEHRGVRSMAVQALLSVAKAHLSQTSQKPVFSAEVHALIHSFWRRLIDENGTLHRKKADIVKFVAPLLVYIPDKDLRHEIIHLLVQLWRDPDSEIRTISIGIIKLLAETGLPEVAESFTDQPNTGNRPTGPEVSSQRPSNNLMKEIASLMSNQEYGEKEHLNDLLKWFFMAAASTRSETQNTDKRPQPRAEYPKK